MKERKRETVGDNSAQRVFSPLDDAQKKSFDWSQLTKIYFAFQPISTFSPFFYSPHGLDTPLT